MHPSGTDELYGIINNPGLHGCQATCPTCTGSTVSRTTHRISNLDNMGSVKSTCQNRGNIIVIFTKKQKHLDSY